MNKRRYGGIRAEGFGTRSSFADADRPFMEVIGQQPAGGTLVQPGTEVEFIASRGQREIQSER